MIRRPFTVRFNPFTVVWTSGSSGILDEIIQSNPRSHSNIHWFFLSSHFYFYYLITFSKGNPWNSFDFVPNNQNKLVDLRGWRVFQFYRRFILLQSNNLISFFLQIAYCWLNIVWLFPRNKLFGSKGNFREILALPAEPINRRRRSAHKDYFRNPETVRRTKDRASVLYASNIVQNQDAFFHGPYAIINTCLIHSQNYLPIPSWDPLYCAWSSG